MRYKSTTRSLTEISHKILKKSQIIETTISDLLTRDVPIHVLEVGFGWGRALLELSWRFRHNPVTFYGVDATKSPPMEKPEDLLAIARQFNIIPEKELMGIKLPHLNFYDATHLHYDDESMDVIYSAVTIRFMKQKAEFIEEVCRVLKPGGIAMLHIGEANWNYPYSVVSNDEILTPYTSRFILKHENELIPFPVYVKLCEGELFQFQFTPKSRLTTFVKKLAPGHLSLRLSLNQALTVPGEQLPLLDKNGVVKDGIRTVYDVDPKNYQTLFSQGLLSRESLQFSDQVNREAGNNVSLIS